MESRAAGYAQAVANFMTAMRQRCSEPDAQQAVLVRLIDTIGCLRGAFDEPAVRQARSFAMAYSQTGPDSLSASMVGASPRVTVEAAAFVNGVAARYLDFNDIYLSREAVHPSDNIPAGLALAEALRKPGRDVCTALALGYEVHCRMADAVSTRKGRWDNVILGAIGASAMTGALLELDAEQQANAINIAATGNTALMQTRVGVLSMWKAAAAAYAARAGVFASTVAAHGLTGPEQALDGSHGLFAQVTGQPEVEAFADTGTLRLLDTHLKAYPSQYFTQTAISAAMALRAKLPVARIRKVVVSTFEFGRVAAADGPDKWHPRTRETADHSMPYCVAAALLDGTVTQASFDESQLAREDLLQLTARIQVIEDPALTAAYPEKVPTRIVAELDDGTLHEALAEYPLGHSRQPMSDEQVAAKFLDLCGSTAESRALLDGLRHLAALDGEKTARLIQQALRI